MSLLPVKTCTCTQDKKQTAGTDYDGQSLCSFKFPLQPSFGVSRSYRITLRRLRVNSSRVRTSNGEYVPVNITQTGLTKLAIAIKVTPI